MNVRTKLNGSLINVLAAVCLSGFSLGAFAETYEISITNVTRGESFTPRLATTHIGGNLFTVGEPAIDEIVDMAEGGDVSGLMTLLESAPEIITDVVTDDGLLDPGVNSVFTIEGNPGEVISLVAMLIPTNDAFVAVNALALPSSGSVTYRALVYDAGSESNDELCANIPGPVCGGTPGSPEDDGEGFVHVHAGIHGVGDLPPENYDWRNPGAIVTITLM